MKKCLKNSCFLAPNRIWILLFFCVAYNSVFAQSEIDTLNQDRMKWFKDAKFGIFIHWGIYAVNGVSESWSFYNGYISHEDYMKQLNGFSAKNYDPERWADLIQESGAKYAVLTSKHHDGVALWNSKFGGLNIVQNTPAKRDLIQPLMDALRKRDLKTGLYFSLIDWSHRDYDVFTKKIKRYEKDSIRWRRFLNDYEGQLLELSTNYNPDLFWFDGDWEHSAEAWEAQKMRNALIVNNKNVILNSRLAGYGDYATPEQGVPIFKPKDKYWELCMTMNDNWGYQKHDNNYKSSGQLLNILVDCISKGGNLLLNISPKADGNIDEKQVQTLKEMGRWTKKHSEAIYGTTAGIPLEYTNYPSTISSDSTTLYVFVKGKPSDNIYIKGLKNNVLRARIVGNGTVVETKVVSKAYWSSVPGILNINVPDDVCDDEITVVALLLDGKINLYR
jgi:alpha-L-fucosidase